MLTGNPRFHDKVVAVDSGIHAKTLRIGAMSRIFITSLCIAVAFSAGAAFARDAETSLVDVRESLPPLPGPGLAGSVAGQSNNHLIIAGGANFPNAPLWETDKVWHDEIHVLDLASPENGWRTLESRLPNPIAYGVSLTHPTLGVISIGGGDGEELIALLISWRNVGESDYEGPRTWLVRSKFR